jgi:hypothetical protein
VRACRARAPAARPCAVVAQAVGAVVDLHQRRLLSRPHLGADRPPRVRV